MMIINDTKAIVLVFPTTNDLRGTIKNLEGLVENIDKNGKSPPHMYAIYDKRITREEILEFLNTLRGSEGENIDVVEENKNDE